MLGVCIICVDNIFIIELVFDFLFVVFGFGFGFVVYICVVEVLVYEVFLLFGCVSCLF